MMVRTLQRVITAGCLVLLLAAAASAGWERRPLNTLASLRDVFFLTAERGWIVGGNGVIFSTLDGGKTWAARDRFTTDDILQIYFTDADTGWMLCQRNVFSRGKEPVSYLRKTVDGGHSWEKIEFEDADRERVTKLLFSKDGRARAFGEGGIFYQLQDDGKTWKKYHTAIHFLLLDGALSDSSIGAIVGAGGTIMFTEDNGMTWDRATLLPNSEVKFNAVYFAGSKAGAWAVGNGGQIFHSNGGARLWRPQNSTVTADLNDVTFSSPHEGWAVGESGIIVRTGDGGQTWSDIKSPVNHTLQKITFINGHGWAVGFGGTIIEYDATKPDDPGFKPGLQKRA
ncbi:MAG TPA: YCF48-related protein [Pyrinomonadaceae bacterium]|nr:YCF48-related protein [Pyrinomonadaceae bacterium]